MSNQVTLVQLERDVRWQGDQLRAQLRHTPADIRRVITQSAREYREMISDGGHPYYLKQFGGILPTGRAHNPNDESIVHQWTEINTSVLHPPLVRIYGLDVHTGQYSYRLDQVSFNDRMNYQFDNEIGDPTAWFGYGGDTVCVVPPVTTPFKFTLWYLPEMADLINDTDEFDPAVPNGTKWVIWDCLHKILIRDNYPSQVQMVWTERERARDDVLNRVSFHGHANAMRRRDTRGERGLNKIRSWRGRMV